MKSLFQKAKQGYDTGCQKLHTKASVLVVAAASSMSATSANAAVTDLGSMGTRAGSQGTGLTTGALQIAAFIGVVMFITALIKGRSARDQNESIGKYVAMGIVGAFMFAIPVLIGIFNNSLLGTTGTSTNGVTL